MVAAFCPGDNESCQAPSEGAHSEFGAAQVMRLSRSRAAMALSIAKRRRYDLLTCDDTSLSKRRPSRSCWISSSQMPAENEARLLPFENRLTPPVLMVFMKRSILAHFVRPIAPWSIFGIRSE